MAVEIKIQVKNTATAGAQVIEQALKGGGLYDAMGAGLKYLIKDHLGNLNSTRANKLGGKRSNFYASAARETFHTFKPGEFTVTIDQIGFEQRLRGGTIRPTGGRKFLTIPAAKESYGRRASEFGGVRSKGQNADKFNDLVVLFGRRGPYALAEAVATKVSTGKRGNKNRGVTGGRVLYWLKKEVTQKPDPSVLPSEAQMASAIEKAGENYINAALARANQNGGQQ